MIRLTKAFKYKRVSAGGVITSKIHSGILNLAVTVGQELLNKLGFKPKNRYEKTNHFTAYFSCLMPAG